MRQKWISLRVASTVRSQIGVNSVALLASYGGRAVELRKAFNTLLCAARSIMDMTQFEYVGFWARVVATLIDTAIGVAISWPFVGYLRNLNMQSFSVEDLNVGSEPLLAMSSADLWSSLLMTVAILLFWVVKQATPGKIVIRARIVDATTGGKPSTAQLLLRYVGYYVSMIPLFAGFAWAAFDPRKQGWHDKMANTVVIRPLRSLRAI